MSKPEKPSALENVLELGPSLIFFVMYLLMKDSSYTVFGREYSGFIAATACFIPIVLAAMVALWVLKGRLSPFHIFTIIMVVFFGGLTIFFNSEAFFQFKTTLVYCVMAGLLGIGLLQGKSYLSLLMNRFVPMEHEGWMILTRRAALAFLTLAAVNEFVWRLMSKTAWVYIETFGFPIALAVFLTWQFTQLEPYVIEETDEE